MDLQAQLKKYKFELNEITNSKKLVLDRENKIYNDEKDRIQFKYAEYLADLENQKKLIHQSRLIKMDELEKVKNELANINTALEKHKNNKFKLREELLANIQATNKLKKEVRKTNTLLNQQKTDLESEIQIHKDFIANYENKRRQINEDYYNLQSEINETRARIDSLPASDRKIIILQDYLKELENDSRANPTTRYTELDAEINTIQNKIANLEYKLQKHLNYMQQMQKNVNTTHELFLSTYLEDARSQIPNLLEQQRCKFLLVNSIQNEINTFDEEFKKLNDTRMPSDLKDQEERADVRLSIITKRTCADCDPLINELTQKILDIETQIQTLGWKNVINNIVELPPVESTVKPAANTIPNDTGQSRKALERQRKLANQTM